MPSRWLLPATPWPATLLALALTVSLGGLARPALARPFERSLSLQGLNVVVQASGEGSMQQLTIRASRRGRALPVVRQEVDGQVIGAEVEDLNSDGRPELFVYTQSAGSGSYGSVLAWSTPTSGGLLPIHLQELGASDTRGYRGHDQFAVVETTLVRRFPLYREGDSNARPSGGIRQVSYKLIPGEAMWQLKPVSSTEF